MVGNFDFLKGNIETIILNALYGGDKYGYDITREIKEKPIINTKSSNPLYTVT